MQQRPRESYINWRRRVLTSYEKVFGEPPPPVLSSSHKGLLSLATAVAAHRAAKRLLKAAPPQAPVPYVGRDDNVMTEGDFEAVMRDAEVAPELLTDAEVDAVLREYGWLPDPHAGSPGWYSGVVDLTDPKGKTWPTRMEMDEVDAEGYDPLYPMEGFLAIAYRRDDGQWTEWQRVGKDRRTWDWAWPDAQRFYGLLRKLRAKAHDYAYRYARFRWLPYPAGIDRATVMHGVENCAIAILKARFPVHARALSRIGTDGGFGQGQLWEASGVLKRNMRLLNRIGGVIFESKKDGQWRYNGKNIHGNCRPPVDLFDLDGHALGSKPERPSWLCHADVVTVDAVGTYRDMKRQYGIAARIWPSSEGYIIDPDTGLGDEFIIRDARRYAAIERRSLELQIIGTALVSSPFSVEVKAWRVLNDFDPTPEALAKIWKAANVYPCSYSNLKKEPGPSADVNSAYESSPRAGAKDLFLKYGFPRATGQIVVKDPPMGVLQETGLVVAHLNLEQCHPWVRYQVRESRGVYTTMRLQTWLDAGAVVIDRLELAVVAQRYWPSLDRPVDARYSPLAGERWVPGPEPPKYNETKHWGREAIGRLVPNGEKHQDYLYIIDDAEAASVIQTLRSLGILTSFDYERDPKPQPADERPVEVQYEDLLQELLAPAQGPLEGALSELLEPLEVKDLLTELEQVLEDEQDGMWKVGFKQEGLPKDSCFHAHSYWLDYSAMVIDREVFRHPWDAVVRIATDSITLAQGHAFSDQVEYEAEVPGKWKRETPKMREYAEPVPREVPDLAEVETLAGAYWAPICSSEPRMHVLEGPPGFGKTYHCLERLAGHKYVVLTPTRKMRKKFSADGHKALTWRWALRPYATFKPDAVRVPRGTLLYLPEIGTWPRSDVEVLVPWLLENGYRLLADGDREQMRPVKAEPPWAWLDAEPAVTIERFMEKDYRSKTAELAALKMRLRGKTNAGIIDELRCEIGETDYQEFLEAWHPRDYVYACVHVARNVLHEAMEWIHEEKYPNEPVRIVYTEKDRQRSGEEEYIPLGAEIPDLAELAYTTTYTSCQGETAGPDENGRQPRVWLVDARASEFFKGALYTGATRPEYLEQLGLVGGVPIPPTARELAAQEDYSVDDELPLGYNED